MDRVRFRLVLLNIQRQIRNFCATLRKDLGRSIFLEELELALFQYMDNYQYQGQPIRYLLLNDYCGLVLWVFSGPTDIRITVDYEDQVVKTITFDRDSPLK